MRRAGGTFYNYVRRKPPEVFDQLNVDLGTIRVRRKVKLSP